MTAVRFLAMMAAVAAEAHVIEIWRLKTIVNRAAWSHHILVMGFRLTRAETGLRSLRRRPLQWEESHQDAAVPPPVRHDKFRATNVFYQLE